MSDAISFSVQVAAVRSGISRSKLYEAIRDGKLQAKKFGRSTLIREVDLSAFLDSLPRLPPKVGARQ
jgi:excisionase family DNA binding protein